MMLHSFHKLFCELGAMCKSDQLFPCTVVTTIISGTRSLLYPASPNRAGGKGFPVLICPREGHWMEQLKAAVG